MVLAGIRTLFSDSWIRAITPPCLLVGYDNPKHLKSWVGSWFSAASAAKFNLSGEKYCFILRFALKLLKASETVITERYNQRLGSLRVALGRKVNFDDRESWHFYWCIRIFVYTTLWSPQSQLALSSARAYTPDLDSSDNHLFPSMQYSCLDKNSKFFWKIIASKPVFFFQ